MSQLMKVAWLLAVRLKSRHENGRASEKRGPSSACSEGA